MDNEQLQNQIDNDDYEENVTSLSLVSYLDKAIKRAQYALTMPNFDDGLLRYIMLIDHMLVHVRADGKLDGEDGEFFEKQLSNFKETKEYMEESNPKIKKYMLADKKLELILSFYYGNEEIRTPFKIK